MLWACRLVARSPSPAPVDAPWMKARFPDDATAHIPPVRPDHPDPCLPADHGQQRGRTSGGVPRLRGRGPVAHAR
ncbi:hypothetical protein DY926_08870 [Komagataeibacter melaceti]|uniref:Uncharacterized protein n=1 Tax=Komagataeibacter melaceti TaxID=2766577 RepID=A0A371Z083_9PROT|nr:hypothetical protein DY926_08870 [Komagataeibacter melaceti]